METLHSGPGGLYAHLHPKPLRSRSLNIFFHVLIHLLQHKHDCVEHMNIIHRLVH